MRQAVNNGNTVNNVNNVNNINNGKRVTNGRAVTKRQSPNQPPTPPKRPPSGQESERVQDRAQVLVATAGALLIGVLYLALPDELSLGPRWLLLVVEALLLAPVAIAGLLEERRLPFRVARSLALALLFVTTAALIGSIFLLISHISHITNGVDLLRPAVLLWAMNVLVWAVWYWEMDGNGPRERLRHQHKAADFLFPQQQNGNPTGWAPYFVDYLFLAFCFATALSPADTSPLTRRAKLLMMAEAILSMLVIVVLVARSINIIS